jgi:ferrous iron transport protein B
VAVTGEGIKKLISRLKEAKDIDKEKFDKEKMWENIGKVVNSVQRLEHHHHTFLERLEEISIRPITGLPIAIVVVILSFFIVRFIGESLIKFIFDPIFEKLYAPILMKLSLVLGQGTFIHNIIVGKLFNGQIDFRQSFGLLTTGLYIELGAVLPYVLSFYLVLSLLEDFGYLPRLAVLVDNVLHQIGLHGYAIITFRD